MTQANPTSHNFQTARINMVNSQIRPNKVTSEKLIQAFLDVPREEFVLKEQKGHAYVDADLPLAPGRAILAPMVLARLLQAADIQPTDKVLVVGAGLGYAAAICSQLARQVVALESDATLHRKSKEVLTTCGYKNVKCVKGDLKKGAPDFKPYDCVIINGSIADGYDEIINQLNKNGVLVSVISSNSVFGVATLIQKDGKSVTQSPLFEVNATPLPEFAATPSLDF